MKSTVKLNQMNSQLTRHKNQIDKVSINSFHLTYMHDANDEVCALFLCKNIFLKKKYITRQLLEKQIL